MIIERLSVENLRDGVFCAAAKPGSDEMYGQFEAWLEGGKLRGLVARSDGRNVAGFVIYYPIEHAPLDIEGEGLYVVQCVFVKPEYQKTGIGKHLVEAAVADARASGASGLAVEGFKSKTKDGFDFMPGAFFRHMGMVTGDSRDQGTIYYVSFGDGEDKPKYLEPSFNMPTESPKVKIDILDCRRCYVGITNRNLIEAVLEQAAVDNVELVVHDQTTRDAILDKGMSSGVFVDGKLTFFDGHISEDDVMNAIEVAMSAREKSMDK
ncbi:MAG: GNAT family N-acetyltransferase [Armatimonadota bacterium]|nr:GNAT family N-acetyltransferase [bacterium]